MPWHETPLPAPQNIQETIFKHLQRKEQGDDELKQESYPIVCKLMPFNLCYPLSERGEMIQVNEIPIITEVDEEKLRSAAKPT